MDKPVSLGNNIPLKSTLEEGGDDLLNSKVNN